MPVEVVLNTLRHVWLTLKPLNVPVAVVGGIALATWKHVRATRDVDLLLDIEEKELSRVLQSLLDAKLRPKRDLSVTDLGQLGVIQLLYEPPETFMDLQVDLLLAKSDYHRNALERRVSVQLADLDIEIAVLTCEDLILHKLLAGRIIDRADAAALLRANRESLEFDYLLQWSDGLVLGKELAEVWNEAFPDEPLP